MKRCDPHVRAKCPDGKRCELYAEFADGSECDKFNEQVLSRPMSDMTTDPEKRLVSQFRNEAMAEFIRLCKGNDFNKLTLLTIGDTIDRLHDKFSAIPTVDAVVLPCKIGTTVFKLQPWEDFVMECTVVEYCITEQAYIIVREKHFNARRGVAFDQIGKSIFFTRKEAENALEERRRQNGS